MKAVFSLHPPALHLTMQLGHISCARVLLEDSNANLFAVNMKYVCVCVCVCVHLYLHVHFYDLLFCHNSGQNCLHILSKYARENAAAIFSLLKQVAPSFPVNKQDAEGYTREFYFQFPSLSLSHTHTHKYMCMSLY